MIIIIKKMFAKWYFYVFKSQQILNAILLLLIVSFSIALLFLIAFIILIKQGEYDDLDSPPLRLLMKDKSTSK